MNLFNEAIYKNHLEHTAEGTKWGKHKYLYITPSGRYVYPYDLENTKTSSNPKLAAERNRAKIKAASDNAYKDQIRSAHQGSALRNDNSISRSKRVDSSGWRTQSIANASGQKYGQQIEAQKRAEEERRKNTAKTSGVAAGSKSVASNAANRNTVTIKSEEKKTETATSTSTEDKGKYKNMSEEMKTYLEKEAAKGEKKEGETKKGSGKKGGSGKKKGSSSSSKKSASTKTQEANQMGLSDDDLKNMEVNTEATNRDEVLKNIALRVIRGDYGNGADRKAKLGNYYDEVQKRVNELMRDGSVQREGQPKQENTPSSNKSSNTSSTKEYKREDYKKGDKDFDDKNYSDKNRLGNTDFFSYKRDDGKYVILEEDMKWVVDEKPSSKMIKNLEAMDEYIDARQKNGTWEGKNAAKEWDRLASIAINGGDLTKKAEAEKAKVKNKKSVKHYDLEEGLFLKHWGKKRRSGRYRFGSGDRPYQHETRHRNSTFSDRRSMSNEDLDAAITRARKEVELYRAERDNRSQGQRFVEDVITSVGKDVLRTAGKGALLWAGKNFAIKVLQNEELGDFIARGGPKKEKNK